jgi:hypothetical protein
MYKSIESRMVRIEWWDIVTDREMVIDMGWGRSEFQGRIDLSFILTACCDIAAVGRISISIRHKLAFDSV